VRALRVRALVALAAATAVAGVLPAQAAVPHIVQPGETLWSIAAANNFTTRTLAAFNGLSEDARIIAGTTLKIPTEAEGAAALADAGVSSSSAAPAAPAADAPYGLAPGAAESWSAMRADAQANYGVDLYPSEGPLSAFRTYEQQAQLYELYLSGQGAPANPPGTSTHDLGLAVDLATPEMRSVIDQIGPTYGWHAPHSNEWWHVEYWG
jgi:LysM repeat protein